MERDETERDKNGRDKIRHDDIESNNNLQNDFGSDNIVHEQNGNGNGKIARSSDSLFRLFIRQYITEKNTAFLTKLSSQYSSQ